MTARTGVVVASSISSRVISNVLWWTLLRSSPRMGVLSCFASLTARMVQESVG